MKAEAICEGEVWAASHVEGERGGEVRVEES